jgi:hypothetical protein
MIKQILKVLGVGIIACLSSLMFVWYYPFVCIFLYFSAGLLARMIMADKALVGGLIVSLPGIIFVSGMVLEERASIVTSEVAIWYIFVPAALVGSLLGLNITKRLARNKNQ